MNVVARSLFPSLLVTVALYSAEDPWRYVEPSSKMLMGIQWRSITESAAAAQFQRELRSSMPLPSLPGIDLLNSIENILVASPGAHAGKQDAPVLIILSGQFDLAKLKASVQKRSRRAVVQNIEIFESPGSHMGMALVSPETLLLGDVPSLVRAVGSAAPPVWDSILLNRARNLDDLNDFWVLSSGPLSETAGQSIPTPVPINFHEVQSLEVAVHLRDGFALSLAMQMLDSETAKKLKSELTKTVQLAGKEKNRPELAGLDRFLKITADDETLRVIFELSTADVQQRVRTYQAKHRAPTPAPNPVASIPPRPAITKPTIWNADPPQD